MTTQKHFILMANYNQRMNQQVYNAACTLNTDALHLDRGAYFKSIMGTLNHILVGDIFWLTRLSQYSARDTALHAVLEHPKPKGLDAIIYPELSALHHARKTVDACIIDWLNNDVSNNDFMGHVEYTNSQGVISRRNFAELLSHLFNHQTHHRGQISTLFNQLNIDIGVTDFLFDIPPP